MAGWLDKYNDGGPVQENYNDYSMSAPEGWQGSGIFDKGRDYSPAWGGQFANGGPVKRFMQPTETFKNYGYNPIENGMSTEYSTSIGSPGEVYLVPGYRQGRVLSDPEGVFNTYGEHLGGPFKTVQSAENFAKFRHQYVEKNQNIPAPFKTRDYAMGGELPENVGVPIVKDTIPFPANSYMDFKRGQTKNRLKANLPSAYLESAKFVNDWLSSKGAQNRMSEHVDPKLAKQYLGNALQNVNNTFFTVGPNDFSAKQLVGDLKNNENILNVINGNDLDYTLLKSAKNKDEASYADSYTAGFYDPSIHTINITDNYTGNNNKNNKNNTAVHELTHASHLDKFYINNGKQILSKYPVGKSNGQPLYEYNSTSKTKDQSDKNYIQKDGVYPRLMEMRFRSKLNPNKPVTPEMYKKVKAENKDSDLYRYHTDSEILNMLNHFAVNDFNQSSPIAEMGGSLPGAVGFMYARTNDPAPSNGPYAKKTKASAENGAEMKYYQEGLDFKPKTISRDGSQLIKLDQLTNFTNYNTKQPGGWLDKYEG